jgi:hypothetical protein
MSETDAAADAARSAELERLRRLAFGRTSTADEAVAAEEAQRELSRVEADAVVEPVEAPAPTPVAEPVEAPEPEPSVAGSLGAGVAESLARFLKLHRAELAGLAVGAVVAGGLVWTLHPGTVSAPDAVPTPTSTAMTYFLGDPPTSSDVPGDLAAAERWFADEQTDDDLVGVGDLRPEFDRDSVRLVHDSRLARVWVVRQLDGKLCVYTTETETQSTVGSCVDSVEFERRGISVTSNVLTASWNGSQVRVVLTQRAED